MGVTDPQDLKKIPIGDEHHAALAPGGASPDTFGNALGSSIADSGSRSTNPASSYGYESEMDRASDSAYAARQAADSLRTPGDFARTDGAAYRNIPYELPNAGNGLRVGQGGLGLGLTQEALSTWDGEINGGIVLRAMRDSSIDAAVTRERAPHNAAQTKGSGAGASARINPINQVLGFAQAYPALAGEVNALEGAVRDGYLTADQARGELMKSPRAYATLRRDYEVFQSAPAGTGQVLSAWGVGGRASALSQAPDPRAGTVERQIAQGVTDGVLLAAGPEAVLGSLALKGAVAALGMTRVVGSEIGLALRAAESSGGGKVPSQLLSGKAVEAEQLASQGVTDFRQTLYRPSQDDINSPLFKQLVGEARYTNSGMPRGTYPDYESAFVLQEIKSGSSILRDNYQMRLQLYKATAEGKNYLLTSSRPVETSFTDFLRQNGTIIRPLKGN